jgi:hypothetical protein
MQEAFQALKNILSEKMCFLNIRKENLIGQKQIEALNKFRPNDHKLEAEDIPVLCFVSDLRENLFRHDTSNGTANFVIILIAMMARLLVDRSSITHFIISKKVHSFLTFGPKNINMKRVGTGTSVTLLST